jgi:hypothetical protein
VKFVICKRCGRAWYTEVTKYSVTCSRCKSQVLTGFTGVLTPSSSSSSSSSSSGLAPELAQQKKSDLNKGGT